MIQEKPESVSQKQELVDALIRSTNGLEKLSIINFLVGYSCGAMKLLPNRSNRICLSNFLMQLFENSENGLISLTNLYEIVTEATTFCCDKKVATKQLVNQYEKRVHMCVNEIAMNPKFLKYKWMSEVQPKLEKSGSFFAEERRRKEQESMSEDETMKLIKKMQEQENRQDERRRQMESEEEEKLKSFLQQERKQREEADNQVIECQICLQEISYEEMGTLECGHIFHRKCLRDHIEALVNDKKLDIECPMGCGGKLTVADVHEFIDRNLREKYEKFSFDVYVEKNQGETSWCPTPGCTAAFSWEDELDNYRCPACKSHYCLKCRCNYHYGQTCAEYRVNNSYGEDDKKFEEFVRGAKYKQCPKCKFWVERIEGCSTMSCRCGHEFCYDCGGSDCPHGACKHLHPVVHPVRPPVPRRPRGRK